MPLSQIHVVGELTTPRLLGPPHSVQHAQVQCFGENIDGQAQSTMPGKFTYISSGYLHTCGVTTDGDVKCFGWDEDGQAPATTVASDGSGYTMVECGREHTCAVTSNGAVDCWGNNKEKQAPTAALAPVDTVSAYTDVTCGGTFTCALTSAGDIDCWGKLFGQKSRNPTTRKASVDDGPDDTVFAGSLSAGAKTVCALNNHGWLECWGGNDEKQLPDVSGPDSPPPPPPTPRPTKPV